MIKKEYIGVGAISKCEEILKKFSGKTIFLVRGRYSYGKSNARKLLKKVFSRYKVITFHDFTSNPKIKDIKRGIAKIKKVKADIVMAVGGGSVIDMAKMINFFSVNKINNMDVGKLDKKIEKPKPLIAIPTTAGSGSEATHFAVIYKGLKKYSLAHKYLLPDSAIIDPVLTMSLSKDQAAISAMDALSQAVESYWSVNSTEQSKTYAKKAIELILPNILPAVNKGNKKSKEAMAIASHLAGKAINITKTTAAHAISYPMTVYYNIAHGHAVSLTLADFFISNSNLKSAALNEKRGKDYLNKVMLEICRFFECTAFMDFPNKWYALMKSMGLESDLKKLGIRTQSDVNRIINNVNMERLKNNPVKINKTILRRIFKEKVYEQSQKDCQ